MGPLCCAIIVWRNSLVFHSLDKVTSFFLHALPPMSLHLTRYGGDEQQPQPQQHAYDDDESDDDNADDA